ncbi:LOW QUALITY PROTEIN: prion-inhibition and propagation-domain-containing protein [Neurospora tetraspora]|uniref:Prion-inhibition and propagation-domain-containing protein n=1 Tax=Neurospora tetraspora TaxID=94610 RepID=A0AAE0JGA7_9PEZI|nr:LOW QUALITY PROTEIN: prion-inhibition and propagation-domain-containing protein [Neurospora tetraspora]
MEPAGLALGVIGLAGIFKSCVELFGYFSTYRSYGHDYILLDAKLHVEKAVLLQWADRVRLLHDDYDRRLDNPTIREAVSEILSYIIHLLSESSSLQQRYGMKEAEASPPHPPKPQNQTIGGSLMEKFMDDYNAMQVRMHQRKATTSTSSKLKWMIVDKDRFNALIEDLSHFTSRLDRAVSLLASLLRHEMASIYKESSKTVLQQATDDRLGKNAILQEAQDQDKALKSLWFRCMGDRKDSVSPAHVKTLQWALKPACEREGREAEWDDLSEWLRSGTGLYWICGKAGSGKSTLMKHLHDNPDTRAPLKAWAGDLPLSTGSFFFWGLGRQEQKSLEGLSRALLYQLLEAESSYIPSALPRLWQEIRTDVEKVPAPPSSGELRAASEFMVKNFQPKRRFCLFIDGLDEFEGNFHDAIKGLCSNSEIKIIVSSRPIAICYDAFSRLHMEHLTSNDIKEYIQDTVGSHAYMEVLTASGEQSPNMITNKLIEKASGVFLWVILAYGFAAHDTLCRRVDDLPPELEDLFVHMLNSVDRRYHEQMAKTLKILYSEYRARDSSDAGLKTIKLACFNRNDMDCTSNLPLESFPVHEARKICLAMVARLRSRCGGLLQTVPRWGWGHGVIDSNDRLPYSLKDKVCWCPLREKCPQVGEGSHPLSPKYKVGDFAEHSQIEFIHRAVFEFLDNPNVWNLPPLRISDPTFSAACAIVGMDLQLYYLYCKNGAETDATLDWLLMIDNKPLECVVPVLAKLADCVSLRIAQKDYTTEETIQPSFSSFLKPAYDRSSLQLSLLMAVELGLVNTVGSLLPTVGPRPLGPRYFPFPILYHSVRSPLLYSMIGYLLSQGFPPNELFADERGLPTTPWRSLIVLEQKFWQTRDKDPPYKSFLTRKSTHDMMRSFIEHGAELDYVVPGISTVEEFFNSKFVAFLPEDPSPNAIAERRRYDNPNGQLPLQNHLTLRSLRLARIMAAETLASSAGSEQDKGPDTQLDGSLDTQADKKVDGNGKADTGSNPKPDIGRKVNLKAVQEPLWWLLVVVILALSIYMKSGFLSQVES